MRRSMLFLPGNNPNMMINGADLGADSIILDLEDAVSPDEKDTARFLVRNAIADMGFAGVEITVRINSIDTADWKQDLEAIVPLHPDLIMIPKSGTANDILTVDKYIEGIEERCGMERGAVRLIPLIETALGVENAYAIASACSRVAAIFLGGEDLTADLRCKRTKAEYAKSLGFTGKSAIAPRHVKAINSVFSPTMKDIEYAKMVFEAIRRGKEQGKGAVSLLGKMIDKPIVERARQTLEAAKALGLEVEIDE